MVIMPTPTPLFFSLLEPSFCRFINCVRIKKFEIHSLEQSATIQRQMERLSKMRDGFDPTAPGEFSTPQILSPTTGFDYVKKSELESKFKVDS